MLNNIKPGDIIRVTTKEGYIQRLYNYRLEYLSSVSVPQTGQTFIEVRDRVKKAFLDMDQVTNIEKEGTANV